MNEVTRFLNAAEQGDSHAAAQLLPLVYDELRKLAAAKMAWERPDHTLDATAPRHLARHGEPLLDICSRLAH
jgi:ECF sigma factor